MSIRTQPKHTNLSQIGEADTRSKPKITAGVSRYVEDYFWCSDEVDARIFAKGELDEETGLYYYWARYLDPRYSRWLSGDPALNDYIPKAGADTSKLPNGGVYNTTNLQVFNYGNNNPVKYNDPTGEYAEITQEGNNITIIIPVKFKKGTTDEQKALFKSAAESYWTGTYGDKNVKLIVEERKRGRKNRVRFSNREGTSYVFASYSAKIYKEDGKTEAEQKEKQKWVIAHEVGHFMYLDDMYEERKYPDGSRKTSPKETWDKNIMAEFWGKVEEKNIDDILKKNRVKIIEE